MHPLCQGADEVWSPLKTRSWKTSSEDRALNVSTHNTFYTILYIYDKYRTDIWLPTPLGNVKFFFQSEFHGSVEIENGYYFSNNKSTLKARGFI